MTSANSCGKCRLLESFLGMEGAEEVGDLVVVVVFVALIVEGVTGDMATLVGDVVEVRGIMLCRVYNSSVCRAYSVLKLLPPRP